MDVLTRLIHQAEEAAARLTLLQLRADKASQNIIAAAILEENARLIDSLRCALPAGVLGSVEDYLRNLQYQIEGETLNRRLK